MTTLQQQNELLTLIGENLKEKTECYLIGGSAMLCYGMKNVTKDIDIVFASDKERKDVIHFLKSIGYKERETKILYTQRLSTKNKYIPLLLQKGEDRFDIFLNGIIDFKLTESIKERITSVYEFSNLIVKVVSPEDIISLKCATERAGDRLDAAEIIKKVEINWDIIIKESIHQTEIGHYLFAVFLFDFLEELKEDHKADIPKEVIKKVRKIAEEQMIKHLKK